MLSSITQCLWVFASQVVLHCACGTAVFQYCIAYLTKKLFVFLVELVPYGTTSLAKYGREYCVPSSHTFAIHRYVTLDHFP